MDEENNLTVISNLYFVLQFSQNTSLSFPDLYESSCVNKIRYEEDYAKVKDIPITLDPGKN